MAVLFFTAICLPESGKDKAFKFSNGIYTVFNSAFNLLQPFCCLRYSPLGSRLALWLPLKSSETEKFRDKMGQSYFSFRPYFSSFSFLKEKKFQKHGKISAEWQWKKKHLFKLWTAWVGPQSSFALILQSPTEFCLDPFLCTRYQHYQTFLLFNFTLVFNFF